MSAAYVVETSLSAKVLRRSKATPLLRVARRWYRAAKFRVSVKERGRIRLRSGYEVAIKGVKS